jgi:outer membrane lipoprotein-sorting protein
MIRLTSFRFPNFARSLREPQRGSTQHGAPRAGARRRVLAASAIVAGLALAVAGLVSLPGAARAEPTATFSLSEQDRADLVRIEQYFNSFQTLRARFQQYAVDSGTSTGNIYLRRPGRLRVEYDPPVPVVIVADGILVSYYDKDLDQVDQLPLKSSPVWFLLEKNVEFDEHVTITAIERDASSLRVSMHQTDDPDVGRVTLIFTDNPLELRQWTVIDAQGTEVRVGLEQVALGGALANELFATPVPRSRYE